MADAGSSFYDDDEAVADYLAHRHSPGLSPNLVMEEPAFVAAVGSLDGLDVIDLGCGDGNFADVCVAGGCASYLGVEASAPMLEQAERRAGDQVGFVHETIEGFSAPPGSADLVAARMSLHYVDDLRPVYVACFDALRPGGRMVVTVVHPLITAQLEQVTEQPRTAVTVDDYFIEGPRSRQWFGRPVTWQHRTLEQHVMLGPGAGFQLDRLSECPPAAERFGNDQDELARRRRVPLILLLSWRRPEPV
ncbi:MAG: class I SAM-dependent methyltransferase [Actinomycetota bacterium]